MNRSIANDTSALSHEDLNYISIAFNAVNTILGLPTNVYVLWLIVTGAGGLVASEFFSLNLIVAEIIYCLSNLLTLIYFYNSNNILFHVASFFAGFIIFGRPLFMSSICVERYLAVVHPVVFLRYRPLRYRVACCGLNWLMVLGLSASYMLVTFEQLNYIILGQYLVMISVNLFCCVSVLRALKRPGPGEGEKEREGMNDMKLRAFRIIVIVMVSVFVTYIPVIVSVIICFEECVDLAFTIALSIIVVTGFVQPLLYLQRAGKLPCVRGF